MADVKITDLTQQTDALANNDIFVVVDSSAGTTKQATLSQVLHGKAALSGSTFTGAIIADSAGGITGSITRTTTGTPFITVPASNIIAISTGSNGQIVISGSNQGAPRTSQYLTLAVDTELSAERVFTLGTGLKYTDAGAGSTYTVNINDGILATISGSTFTGAILAAAAGGITGSITQTRAGTPFITAEFGNAITVSTGSNGQIILSASIAGGSGAPTTSPYVTIGNDGSLSAERALTAGTGINITDGGAGSTVTLAINNGTVATVSGTTFTGAVLAAAAGGVTGSITVTRAGTPFITVPANNAITISTGSSGQIVLSASIGAPTTSPYVTIGSDSSLSAERALTAGTGINITDGGAGSTVTLAINNGIVATVSGTTFTGAILAAVAGGITGSITQTRAGTPFITAQFGNAITVSTGSNGQIILSASISGGSGAPTTSPYVTIGNDGSLSAERALTAGTGINITDAGANSTVTLAINDGVVATVSGTTFTGAILAASAGGITGSITQTRAGTPFITAAANNGVTISTGSNGQIILSSSIGAPTTSPYVTVGNDSSLSSERALTAGTGINITDGGAGSTVTLAINNGVVATVSGTTFTGAVVAAAAGGITGSITQTTAGTPFITAQFGNAITVSTGSNGQIILSASIAGGSGAPTTSPYVTIGNDGSLSAERALTAGSGVNITDGGAGTTVTLAVDNNVVATVSGTTFTGAVLAAAAGGITGSITQTRAGTPFITAAANNGVTISTGSNGQIILSSSIGAPTTSPYVTIGSDSSLSAERALTAGTGINITDGGAGSTVTLAINNGTVATVSGTTFTGAVLGSSTGGFTGSLTQTRAGTPFITVPASNAITITTGSSGQVVLSASIGAPTTSPYVTIGSDSSLSAERALTAGTGILITDAGANSTVTVAINNGTVATVSGTTFTGAVLGATAGGFTGSLTQTRSGTPFITVPANSAITISTGSAGQILLSASRGAPTTAQYLTLATDSQLSVERVLTAGNGIQFTDAGAGGALTVRAANNIAELTASLSYSPTGYGTLSLLHSGTTITTYDSVFRTHNIKGRVSTTNNTITTVCAFLSGANGRSYGVDAFLMAQHTTTTECARWKLSAHYYRTGGSMVLLASDTALSSSNASMLSGTLTISGGNIIVQGTGTSTGSFNWAAELRVQELGV